MGKKKAVFFDIDGTIWNDKNEIPESTVRAIKMLRGNGNLAFLCSGRSRAYMTVWCRDAGRWLNMAGKQFFINVWKMSW